MYYLSSAGEAKAADEINRSGGASRQYSVGVVPANVRGVLSLKLGATLSVEFCFECEAIPYGVCTEYIQEHSTKLRS